MIASPQAPRPSASARAASAEVGRQEPIKKCWNGLQPDYQVADQWNLVNLCFHVRPGKICTWKQNTWVEFEIHKTYKRKSSITCRFETKHLQHLSKNTFFPKQNLLFQWLCIGASKICQAKGPCLVPHDWCIWGWIARWFQLFRRSYCLEYWIL